MGARRGRPGIGRCGCPRDRDYGSAGSRRRTRHRWWRRPAAAAYRLRQTSFPSSELCVGKSRAGLFIYGTNLESGPMTLPWTTNELSASGQVFEFRLWAALTEQSRGQLHVFLPLADRGVDALVHRLTDGAYLELQAKSRSTLMDG